MKKLIWAVAVAAGMVASSAVVAKNNGPSVAVIEFKNESGAGWWRGGVGWELSGMLSNELSGLGSFRVLERSKIEAVLSEQNMGASGRVAGGTAAKIGKITGAQYLIAGTVTSYEEDTASTGGGVSFKGISLGGKSSKAYIAVDVRVINATTGEIDYSRTVEGLAKSGGMSVGVSRGGFGGALSNEKNTPAGKAIRAVLVEITDYLDCVMVAQDGCEAEYGAKERARRDKTRSAIKLDD
jgi:curli biogenesis system outer membrane secretion channel CsgG